MSLEDLQKVLLEKLAELEHEQWSHWMKYNDEHAIHEKDIVEFPTGMWQEWLAKADVNYRLLLPEDRESDREWARKVLSVFLKDNVVVSRAELSEQVLEIDNPSNDYAEVCRQNRLYRILLKKLLQPVSEGE